MSKKALLLTNSFEVLSFVGERKILKLLFSENVKVDILGSWEDELITWSSGQIKLPSILKLTYPITRNFHHTSFSRAVLIKRDLGVCQYCSRKLIGTQITIDHIMPTSRGGKTSFTNCVVACKNCNIFKGNKTPDEANMELIRKPTYPSFFYYNIGNLPAIWHQDWNQFVKIGQ